MRYQTGNQRVGIFVLFHACVIRLNYTMATISKYIPIYQVKTSHEYA